MVKRITTKWILFQCEKKNKNKESTTKNQIKKVTPSWKNKSLLSATWSGGS
jgi:hypothetical protein